MNDLCGVGIGRDELEAQGGGFAVQVVEHTLTVTLLVIGG
jgi:hypothetical protein